MSDFGISQEVSDVLRDGQTDLPIVASVFTPYQLLFLERVLDVVPHRPVCLIDQRASRFYQGRAPALLAERNLHFPLTGRVNDRAQVAMMRKILSEVDAFVGDGPFIFLAASMQWPMNALLYTHRRASLNCRFALIEDGLSTYLEIERSPRELVRSTLREIIARARGFPKRSFWRGHPLGLDLPEVRAILVGARPVLHSERHFVVLPPSPAHALSYTGDAVILLGQPYLGAYGKATLLPFLTALYDDLLARGYSRIAIKPHHYQSEREIALYTDMGFELIDPPITVEELIPKGPFRTVAAINSTGLLTVKSLYGDAVRSIAYEPTMFVPAHEKRNPGDVEAVFRHAGVEIVTFG